MNATELVYMVHKSKVDKLDKVYSEIQECEKLIMEAAGSEDADIISKAVGTKRKVERLGKEAAALDSALAPLRTEASEFLTSYENSKAAVVGLEAHKNLQKALAAPGITQSQEIVSLLWNMQYTLNMFEGQIQSLENIRSTPRYVAYAEALGA